jgi:hypothetical protein
MIKLNCDISTSITYRFLTKQTPNPTYMYDVPRILFPKQIPTTRTPFQAPVYKGDLTVKSNASAILLMLMRGWVLCFERDCVVLKLQKYLEAHLESMLFYHKFIRVLDEVE